MIKIHSIPIIPRMLIFRGLKSGWKKTVENKNWLPDFQGWTILFFYKKIWSKIIKAISRLKKSGEWTTSTFSGFLADKLRAFYFPFCTRSTTFGVPFVWISHSSGRGLCCSTLVDQVRLKFFCALHIRWKPSVEAFPLALCCVSWSECRSRYWWSRCVGFPYSYSAKLRKTWCSLVHHWKQLTCNMSSNIAPHCREPAKICYLA